MQEDDEDVTLHGISESLRVARVSEHNIATSVSSASGQPFPLRECLRDATIMEIVSEYLEVDDWCRLSAVSSFHRRMVNDWFFRRDRQTPIQRQLSCLETSTTTTHTSRHNCGKSMVWTPKERVCRFYRAQKFAQQINTTTAFGVIESAEERTTRGDAQQQNLIGNHEYFLQIVNSRCYNSSKDLSIVWNGFLSTKTCTSLGLDAIQNQIDEVRKNKTDNSIVDDWKELIDLLEHIESTADSFTVVDPDEREKNSGIWRSKVQALRRNCSFSILRMGLPPGNDLNVFARHYAGEDPSLALPQLEAECSHRHTAELFVHVDDRDQYRNASDHNLLETLQGRLDTIQRAIQQDEELPIGIHVWIKLYPSGIARFTELRIDDVV